MMPHRVSIKTTVGDLSSCGVKKELQDHRKAKQHVILVTGLSAHLQQIKKREHV
jgi:hypothetical protein